MPELPEVETVCRTLNRLVTGKRIENVEVRLPRIVRRPDDIQEFCGLLVNQTIRGVERRGKYIRIVTDDRVLVSHLRMEGRYGLYRREDEVEKHTHVFFTFTDGTELRYRDVRQFGTMDLFDRGREWVEKPLNGLGLEPLSDDFTYEAFRKKISGKTTRIKPLLLDQEHVAGLGNIYVDEALFRAGIHPEKTACRLKPKELRRLYHAIVDTLREAVEAGGSSVKSYVNGQGETGTFQHQLNVYGRKDQPCPRCGRPIERIVVAGRGTHVCRKCQPYRPRKQVQRLSPSRA